MRILMEILLLSLAFALVWWAAMKLGSNAGWAQCEQCGIWHHRNGRTSFGLPNECDGTEEKRDCPECAVAAAKRLAAIKATKGAVL